MTYEKLVSVPDGQYYFVKKPYMDGYAVIDVDAIISQLTTIKAPHIYGKDKRNNKPLKELLSVMDNQSTNHFIIAESLDELNKERTKVIYSLQMDLKKHFNKILGEFENEIKNTDHYKLLEKFPEVMI
ncbi:MAG: hypothetical protein DRH57_08560 [Candidatus Cloacimonadota bacterium]|nr:MAG: hypothetical protein DRH57_08560 [Candidatus Cloacimonadota bacterium]